ncbi:MAG: hypothetical protein GY870_01535 [archaeon]|nr:hypothetical protein [archaeon]
MKKLLLILLLITATTHAADIELKWDENNPTPESYSVYQTEEGTPFNYSTPAWTGSEITCTITGLDDCKVYVFVVRANACGNQSEDSNQIQTVITKPEPPKNFMQ